MWIMHTICLQSNFSFFYTFNLIQHVNFGTHSSGHSLDHLVITRQSDSFDISTTASLLLSDHFTVLCRIFLWNMEFEKKRIVTRIESAAFKLDMKETLSKIDLHNFDVKCLVTDFNQRLQNVLKRHALIRSNLVSTQPRFSWINDEIRVAKPQRRHLKIGYQRKIQMKIRTFIGIRKTM